jgi:TolA-binding protein
MKMPKPFPLLLCLAIFMQVSGFSQQTTIYEEPDATYRAALELYNKEKFGAAKELFTKTIELSSSAIEEPAASASYYAGMCAAELFHPDAEKRLMEFISHFPAHTHQHLARFQLGNLNYRKRNYADAVTWYASISGNQLTAEQRNEYSFRRGYSHFMTEDFRLARQMLAQVKDPQSPYFAPANYYYGHIAYIEKEYDTALLFFQKLHNDSNFGPVIPYYITHILFLQEKYDQLLAYAPALLEDAAPRRASEIAKLIGEAHFRKSQFREAIPFLQRYLNESGSNASREDQYQLGFAYYSIQDYEKAIPHLEKASTDTDELAQNAWYHLAASYLGSDQKRFARNAFQQAYQLNIVDDISRESLFNYAMLSFELSLDPYNEAILSFQKYINEYPNADNIAQAHEYLLTLYLTTSNYKEALSSIEKIPVNTPKLREAYQRIAYYRGVELFNNGNFSDAAVHFKKSRQHNENREITALSLFWEGETHYRIGDYKQSVQLHESFLVSPGAFTQTVYNRAHYSIGYAHFKEKNYSAAVTAFRKFINDRNEDRKLLNDAHLRIADSYFISKNYQASLDFYDRAIRIGAIDNDYAILQKGLVYGIMGQFDNKITTLEQFMRNYSQSTYAVDARYEMANTYLIMNNSGSAMNFFNQVISQHPNSSYVKSAMLKTGLIHFNNNDDDRALQVFKEVVAKYPGTPESQEALGAIRNIYVSLDKVDEFFNYSQNIGFANVSNAQQDSLLYIAAENRYMQGDCANAIRSFSNYLERFANGIFSLNAHFYRAECQYRSNAPDQALSDYAFVISRPKSKFSENALSRASQIEYRRGNFQQAYEHYKKLEELAEIRTNILEARVGQMRTLFRMGRFNDAILAARAVENMEKVPPEIIQETNLVLGISQSELSQYGVAVNALNKASENSNNEVAAQALYHLALISFKQGDYATSEKMIFDFVNRIAAHDYWLAKSFLLLADNYLEMENTFQARHTLQSIIDNYPGDDLKEEAQVKMRKIEEIEKANQKPATNDSLEIDFRGGGF